MVENAAELAATDELRTSTCTRTPRRRLSQSAD